MLSKLKNIEVPHTYTLIIGFVVLAVILTYFVPAGTFEMVVDEETGRELIEPGSFQFIDQNPVGIGEFLMSIPEGMVQAATIIFLVFIVGGSFQVINNTGAIDAIINLIISKLNNALYVIPIIMVLMSILGAVGIVVNAVIAFIPIGVLLGKKLNLDPVVGISVVYLGAYSGFTTSPMGPFNTILGQEIAGIPTLSGFWVRTLVWIAIFITTVWYTMKYAKKVQKDKENSVLGSFEWENFITKEENKSIDDFKLKHFLVLTVVLIGFVSYAYGSFNLGWGLNHMSAMMFGIALVSGVLGRMHPDDMAESFITGCKRMVFGALVIGLAKAITIVLTSGEVIHTIIYYMSLPLKSMAPFLSAIGMFWANLIFNFFVPSGSGQAMIVMPLLSPLADVVGITRQVAVSAYQYGDGFANTIIPTSGVLMAALGVAGVGYEKWLKFMLPLFLRWVAIGTIMIGISAAVGWVGF
ncbi:MAG: YfcC family protein [Halanaerobiales bacterium]